MGSDDQRLRVGVRNHAKAGTPRELGEVVLELRTERSVLYVVYGTLETLVAQDGHAAALRPEM